jgi:hypothetical protein
MPNRSSTLEIKARPAGRSKERRGRPRRGGRRRLLTLRRCRVCDWAAEVLEPESDPDPACPLCFAPTSRVTAGQRVDFTATAPAGSKNPHAAALGRLGGLKGGPARAAALSPARRKEIAREAARARWASARNMRRG